MQLEEDKFKTLLKTLVYPVCVISGVNQEGDPKAITVSSVTSVSFSPQSLLVCINKDSSFHEILSIFSSGVSSCNIVLTKKK